MKSLYEIAGIVVLRFPPQVRAWAILVVAVNAAALLFITSLYAQVVLLSLVVALVIMGFIYSKLGFVRLLGIGHVTWIVILPWIYIQWPSVGSGTWLDFWLSLLIGINTICLVIDIVDVARFAFGARDPHYEWKESK